MEASTTHEPVALGYETVLDDRAAFSRENVTRLQEAADARLFDKQRGVGSFWSVMYPAMVLPSRPYTWHDLFSLLPIAIFIALQCAKSRSKGSPRLAHWILAEPSILLVPVLIALCMNRSPVEAGVVGFIFVVVTVWITLWAWFWHYDNWKRLSVVSVDPVFDRRTASLGKLLHTPSEVNRARVIQLRVGKRFRHWSQILREGELIVRATKGGAKPLQFALPENVALIDRRPSEKRFYVAGTLAWDDERVPVLIDEPNLERLDAMLASAMPQPVPA